MSQLDHSDPWLARVTEDLAAYGVPPGVARRWLEFGRRPWRVALLTVLIAGPATQREAHVAATRWADGQLPYADLAEETQAIVRDGLAMLLGPADGDHLLVITDEGRDLVTEFAAVTEQTIVPIEAWQRLSVYSFRYRLAGLSASDRELARLVGLGFPDATIAGLLRLSDTATRARVSRLVRRLDMPSRNALIARLTIEAPDIFGDTEAS